MGHGKLRQEKECLNCGHIVEEHFCPHCGQENTEVRQPFYFLFTHFFEDFTHYDGQFWKSLRYLFFAPGKLTNEYLAGKRQQYVAPVKLYIFISFIVFFIPTLIPDRHEKSEPAFVQHDADSTKYGSDHHKLNKPYADNEVLSGVIDIDSNKIDSKEKYDSLVNVSGSLFYRMGRPFVHKYFELKARKYNQEEISEKFKETFIHTLPKALFLYLPVFAFLLWLFHDKKRWWFFDHGIFTLHFFSFLLLSILFVSLLNDVEDWIGTGFLKTSISVLIFILFVYMMAYFFKAHREVYRISKKMTLLKGTLLFFINAVLLLSLLIGLIIISFLFIH